MSTDYDLGIWDTEMTDIDSLLKGEVERIKACPKFHILIFSVCEYATFLGKRDFADVVKLKI